MDSDYKPTFFDSQLQSHQLQIMKTMIPYLSAGQQRPFALLIKYMELQKEQGRRCGHDHHYDHHCDGDHWADDFGSFL